MQYVRYALQDFSAFHHTKERLWIRNKASRSHIHDLEGLGYRRNAQRHIRESSKPSKNNVIEIKVRENNEAWLRSTVRGFADLDVPLDGSMDWRLSERRALKLWNAHFCSVDGWSFDRREFYVLWKIHSKTVQWSRELWKIIVEEYALKKKSKKLY